LISNLFVFALLAVSLCESFPQSVMACDQIPAGQTFRIRLSQPVSSYSSKRGTPLLGFLIESPQCDGVPAFPRGTVVDGHVASVHKVGIGFRHEIATLGIEFDRIRPDDGQPIEMRTQVLEVDNAREKVRDGVIHGIRSTNTPQDHLSSRVAYLLMWDPQFYWILPAYRALFPVLPEPELYFPSGTDLSLKLSTPLLVAHSDRLVRENPEFDQTDRVALDEKVLSLPERTVTPQGQDADVVNLAFIGSRGQVDGAFKAAGWKGADAMSAPTALREIGSFLLLRNYPRGPMSKQLLRDHPSDFRWQKGLDSIARRDHLRIWSEPETWQGQPVWLSASTREIGASFSLRRRRFVHHVDGAIDVEREKVVRDLTLAGCVETVHNAPRPAMPPSLENATGGELQTDGAVAIVQLKDCDSPVSENDLAFPTLAARPRSKIARYFRTQVLSIRDIWRENAAYGVFELGRMTVRSIRHSHRHPVSVEDHNGK
jgi:LssY-like putative type I secretion system component LssY